MIGRTVGDYVLLAQAATSPWGVVYDAEHPAFGRVSLEVLDRRFAGAPEQVRRFRAGGEALAALRHVALRRVHEIGEKGGQHFIAREPIRGQPLSQLLAEQGAFEHHEAFRMVCRIAGALETAHRVGLRHGAVRPGNVIVDVTREQAVLIGFLCELPEVSHESGLAADAPWYVSPEELRWGHPGDARADVYALALVTFEVCSGQNPFRGEFGDMVRKKLLPVPPSLCALRPEIPPEADRILQQALAPDPAQRTRSAAELAEELYQAFLAHTAPPPTRRTSPRSVPGGVYRRNITAWSSPADAPAATPPLDQRIHLPAPRGPIAGAPDASADAPGPQGGALCTSCEKPVGDGDSICPHCGVARAAPPCPRCGAPVTSAKNRRVFHAKERGYYPWHAAWDGRCEACGFEFTARLLVDPGHYGSLGEGAQMTEVEIRGAESVYTSCGAWEHQPTIEIHVRRRLASNSGTGEGRLVTEARIALTPAEYAAIARALAGPLRVLLERPRWTRDTT